MEIKEIPAQPTVTVRTETTMAEMSTALHKILPAVWGHVQSHGGQVAGPPFSRYYSFSPEKVDMEAGIPVTAPMAGGDGVTAGELPAGKVAAMWHIGPYDTLSKSWMALASWMQEQGLESNGPCWETYWTDPSAEPDSSQWKTELCWPVK